MAVLVEEADVTLRWGITLIGTLPYRRTVSLSFGTVEGDTSEAGWVVTMGG